MIVGTAGHIDHGKTTLVRALTGVDTDRLAEEKRRGITIELGFAPLELDDGTTLGVVDVPGHEAFVRTMLAGATGVDLALLVVAADEGVMPQTTEHLAILTLLGVRAGVVALTKCDLVDDEWRRLVLEDLRGNLAASVLQDAPIVPVSGTTGAGVGELRRALAAAAAAIAQLPAEDLFRMPVDRVFSLKGTGTVVTGTVWSGALRRGSAWIYPPGRQVRVRDLQTHGTATDSVSRGMRAAVALADVGVGEIARGSTLLASDEWQPARTLRCTLRLLDAGFELAPRTRVRLHLGSAEVGARIVPLASGVARLHLDAPIICRAGDRFVVRGGPRLTTLGGGSVVDPFARRRARAPQVAELSTRELLLAFAVEAGAAGVERRYLPMRLGISPRAVPSVLEDSRVRVTQQRVYAAAVLEQARTKLLELVERVHAADQLSEGVPLSDARTAVGGADDLFDCALSDLLRSGALATSGAYVHRVGWRARLDEAQARLAERMMHAFCASPDPTTDSRVLELYGPASLPVLRHLERQGSVVRLGESVAAEPVVQSLVDRLRGHMAPGRRYTPAELRDALGVSRKVLIPLLEYCDRVRVTERHGSERVLRG